MLRRLLESQSVFAALFFLATVAGGPPLILTSLHRLVGSSVTELATFGFVGLFLGYLGHGLATGRYWWELQHGDFWLMAVSMMLCALTAVIPLMLYRGLGQLLIYCRRSAGTSG